MQKGSGSQRRSAPFSLSSFLCGPGGGLLHRGMAFVEILRHDDADRPVQDRELQRRMAQRLAVHLDTHLGDLCEKGSQLRPHIVWFGEAVPLIEPAIEEVERADIFAVIGTSLNVYPAAGLLRYVPKGVPVFLIDPNPVNDTSGRVTRVIQKGASEGVKIMTEALKAYL